jgi:hypothetical protein
MILAFVAIVGLAVFGIRECSIAERAAFVECGKACGGIDRVADSRASPEHRCRCRGVAVYP